ncbi:MAG: SMI1/KNR4 family protein [Steroidobacteraceae bacterium]
MDGLIERVRQRHDYTPASSGAALARFEARSSLSIPDDMRRFYTSFDGARLWGAEYVLLDPDAFLPLGVAVRAAGAVDPSIPDSWTWFARTRVGDCIGIRLGSTATAQTEVAAWSTRDATLRTIAVTFTEFLGRALDGGPRSYWT